MKTKDIISLKEEILKLKKQKDFYLIAHNYVDTDVQDISDYVGDSLQMALHAKKSRAKNVLVCSIRIMGESAKLLSPDKKVYMAHPTADCRLANLNNVAEIKALKEKYPQAEIECYVNAAANLRAESTITCTSANCVEVSNQLSENKDIIFIPDANIGGWVEYKTGRKLIKLESNCYVHHQISLDEAIATKEKYPDYALLVHPECRLEVCRFADVVCSTSQMIDYVNEHDKAIIGTEIGLYEQLHKRFPEKKLVPLSKRMICEDMKMITLELVAEALRKPEYEVILEPEIADNTMKSLQRMWDILRK